ncbi:MAG: glycoside hydrolase [Azospira oryzae]|nr:MAG: glycoside hydrolase [Azospira oryzae]PZP82683.1 MAG: glycoside hydrolase [Azospira oryzae]
MGRSQRKLELVLLWHMHQPDYRDPRTGEFTLPWVYLHALKDYADMAYHLERHPGVKAVVNFVPVLLDQLEDYAEQFRLGLVRDPLLKLLGASNLDQVSPQTRTFILDACFRNNHHTMIEPFPPYKRLHELYRQLNVQGESAFAYLSGQYFSDLLTWYHLAWTGESVRRRHALVQRLMAQGSGFTHGDRLALLQFIGEVVAEVIPRYRRLAQSGQIELSTTPHYHPLAPLLIDFRSAREALPGVVLPQAACYPGGRSRVEWHLDSALESHARRFGDAPAGVWPAEGAISQPLLELLASRGCRWTASGQAVLANTLRGGGATHVLADRTHYLYQPYRYRGPGGEMTCFFRDDQLSDLIGFEYKSWFGRDAANDFVRRLEDILRRSPEDARPLVSVILDGENAWEYYPYNGYFFLDDLYTLLENHPFISTTTYRDYLARSAAAAAPLPPVVAGSWVYGTFSPWIGEPAKNQAWELLAAAKQHYDLVMQGGRLKPEEVQAAHRQLADCESSDWFWWLGDYNPEHAVASFERRFRDKLGNLYRLLKLPVPAALSTPLSRGHGDPEAGGAMRRASKEREG